MLLLLRATRQKQETRRRQGEMADSMLVYPRSQLVKAQQRRPLVMVRSWKLAMER